MTALVWRGVSRNWKFYATWTRRRTITTQRQKHTHAHDSYNRQIQAGMSTHNVLEALKQKIIQEQGPRAPAPARDESRSTLEPQRDMRSSDHRQETSGSRYQSRDSRDHRDTRDARGARDTRDSRDYGERRSYASRDSRDRDFRARGEYRDRRGGDRFERRDDRGGYRGHRDDGRPRGGYRDDRHDDRRSYNPVRERDHRDRREDDMDLSSVVPIDKLERTSLWDVKPKGFEKVSSERAKISGLFPLPGEARKLDISKLEGLVNNGDLNSHTSILFEQINIDALSSRTARELVITGVEFSLYPVDRLVENLSSFIYTMNIEGSFIVDHKLVNNKYLIIRLSNYIVTTILYCSCALLQKELNLKIQISRPRSYITPNELDPDVSISDSFSKIAILNVPSDITESELKEDLEEIVAPNVTLDTLKSNDGSSKGIFFAEFPVNVEVGKAIDVINKIRIRDVTLQAVHACKGLPQMDKVTFRTIAKVARDHTLNIESKVIILLNMIHPEELKSATKYQSLEQDVFKQCSTYGNVESVKIPKPDADYRRNLKHLKTSVGKVFVKFGSIQDAKEAAKDLNGRKYNERTLLVSYLPELDYDLGLL